MSPFFYCGSYSSASYFAKPPVARGEVESGSEGLLLGPRSQAHQWKPGIH